MAGRICQKVPFLGVPWTEVYTVFLARAGHPRVQEVVKSGQKVRIWSKVSWTHTARLKLMPKCHLCKSDQMDKI